MKSVDDSARVGSVSLPSCVMTASGTAGYATELSGYGDLSQLGAVVTKSLAAFAWEGNAAPRVASSGDAMLNAVGLAGPGVAVWRERDLPALLSRGARVVGSVWGRTVGEFADASAAMMGASVVALEVNVSCPNLEDRSRVFAHSPTATAEVLDACRVAGLPIWAKLSPNTPDLVDVARAAVGAGAEALVLTNTVLGLGIDVEKRTASLGNVTGGLSGGPILPIALRAVYDCRTALADVPIVGVGGIRTGVDVVAMVMAGANAVEVGTASLSRPRAPWTIQRELRRWMRRHGVASLDQIRGVAHG